MRQLTRRLLPLRVLDLSAYAAASIATLAAVWSVTGPLGVPGRSGVAAVVWPLAPAAPAVILSEVAARLRADVHRASARGGRPLRGTVLASVAVISLVCVAATPSDVTVTYARNVVLFTAVALASSLLPSPARWMPTILIASVSWLFGPQGFDGDVAAWAVVLHRTWTPAAVAATGVAGVTIALWHLLARH